MRERDQVQDQLRWVEGSGEREQAVIGMIGCLELGKTEEWGRFENRNSSEAVVFYLAMEKGSFLETCHPTIPCRSSYLMQPWLENKGALESGSAWLMCLPAS